MIFPGLRDPDLPALEGLDQPTLARITGTKEARLLRARYQPGARAILHVALDQSPAATEGSVWFYAGTKAQSLHRRLHDARLDPATGALFQTFPHDHRIPHLARFVANAAEYAPDLIGAPAAGPPRLMRYRPGLSATFCWVRDDGRHFFVKQMPNTDVAAQADSMVRLLAATQSAGIGLAFTPVAGTIPDLGLIAYAAAEGHPMDQCLAGAGPARAYLAVKQVALALRRLSDLPVQPLRVLDRAAHLHRAQQACQMIALMDPETGQIASGLWAMLQSKAVPVRQMPIHGDLKLDHVFLAGDLTTLIDMESLSFGDPDYDLAKLEARLAMAALTGQITETDAIAAQRALRPFTGPDYGWFLTCARLQCAKFYAQRADPVSIPQMRKVLDPSFFGAVE